MHPEIASNSLRVGRPEFPPPSLFTPASPVFSLSSPAQVAVQQPGPALPAQHRASSGAWSQEDDRAILALRAMGKSWNQIQREAFPGETENACRKRHERLMEKRGQNDFDTRKLERLSKEYILMRKEIWSPLAARCDEKWNVVEAQASYRPFRFLDYSTMI